MTEETNALPATPPEDDVQIRCPRLGHEIYYKYCRHENYGLPCFKTLDCWFSYFDVHQHLLETMTKEDFEKVFMQAAKPKIHALFDLIQKAKPQKENQK